MKKIIKKVFLLIVSCVLYSATSYGQQDTLTVMTYNVLHYGDGCQGPNSFLHANLKTIVEYASPDLLGMVKVQSIKLNSSDLKGVSPVGFGDSILDNAMNAAYPEKYAYCTLTDQAGSTDNDMDLLFYNQNKLGFVSVVTLLGLSPNAPNPPTEEDFDLYRLYYKDPNLSTTHDTTFLYVILNHTISGTSETGRDQQLTYIMQQLQAKFSKLPNLITMGDMNTHSSSETGYSLYTQSTDTNFLFSDPPFSLDNKLSYPLSWETATSAAPYLNTATREGTLPNACGSDGGAKDWYLHLLLSPWIAKKYAYINYISNSYTTLGNDGNRTGISINDSVNAVKNTSAPANVINALYQLSDKYPVLVKLGVTYNTTGGGPADPSIITTAVVNGETVQGFVKVSNPVASEVYLHFSQDIVGQAVEMKWYDLSGRLQSSGNYQINTTDVNQTVTLSPGMYILNITSGNNAYTTRIVKY